VAETISGVEKNPGLNALYSLVPETSSVI